MQRVRLVGIIFCAALLLSVAPAFATVVNTYTDQASWLAASNGVQNVDFEGLAPTGGYGATALSLTSNGVTFAGIQGSGSYFVQTVDTNAFSYFNFGTGDALMLTPINFVTPVPFFEVSLPSNTTSFGVNLFTVSPQGLSYSITVDGSTFTVPTYASPTAAFFGATFDSPISSLEITPLGVVANGGTYAFLDNFSFGAASVSQGDPVSDAPEAGTLMMIGSGLVGITSIMKRRASRKARQ